MSESDDTDVLLLIPPDLFIVPSTDSDNSEYHKRGYRGGVVSEILEQVQSLETRISVIESKDNSLNASLDSQFHTWSFPSTRNPTFQTKKNSCQLSSLPNTPAKPCFSSSPIGYRNPASSCITNIKKNKMKLSRHANDVTNPINTNTRVWKKHEDLTTLSEPSLGSFHRQSIPLDLTGSKNSTRRGIASRKSKDNREVKEMELSEVDELLQEMEATEIELAKRINSSNSHRYSKRRSKNGVDTGGTLNEDKKSGVNTHSPARRLDFRYVDAETRGAFDKLDGRGEKNSETFADVSLPDEDAFPLEDTDKMISSFKTWQDSTRRNVNENSDRNSTKIEVADESAYRSNKVTDDGIVTHFEKLSFGNNETNRRESRESNCKIEDTRHIRSSETSDGKYHMPSTNNLNDQSFPNIENSALANFRVGDCGKLQETEYGGRNIDDGRGDFKQSQCANGLQQTIREIRATGHQKSSSLVPNHTVPRSSKSRLLTLSDFWDCDGTKSQEEMMRIRLEEERFRREHCEHLIQELQKRLLEQQEKVAVAIRVDSEKTAAISQFQNAWSKLKQRWESLDKEYSELQSTLSNVTDKHNYEISEYQQQIKRGESELSKALDLAAGYKEKSDALAKEKLDLLKSHADELEKYKSLVQEAEQRYENLKIDYNKLLERNKQLEDIGNSLQQELNKERLRNSEVRSEMAVIHKALDTCEAELTILREEKTNLQLKLKEEVTRNGILEQNKIAMLEAINDAKNSEKSAKDEAKSVVDRQEQMRSELREVYQKQVDDVVKTKLKEFQEQLDAAEVAFQADLETKQRAIAECAARKIKSIIDKHQLEINLLEEKHMEEKRLAEIQLAQSTQKASMLEIQLNTQRAGKTHLAEQLHSVMQKQWQQALQIISGGNMESLSPLQRLHAERIFEAKKSKRCNSACCNKENHAAKLEIRSSSSQNLQSSNSRQEQDESLVTMTSHDETLLTTKKESKDDLRKYIQMILDMQQSSNFRRPKYIEQSSVSPPPVTRQIPRKYYVKKDTNGLSEESVTWQHIDEPSVHDTSEYMPIVQSQGTRCDQKNKPPWK